MSITTQFHLRRNKITEGRDSVTRMIECNYILEHT